MKKYFLFFFITCLGSFKARAEFQFYTALIGGSTSFSESLSGNAYEHRNQFFVGHLGGAFGGGYVFTTGIIGLGLKGEIAWIGDSIDRKNTVLSIGNKTYRFETQRLLSGLVFSLRPGSYCH